MRYDVLLGARTLCLVGPVVVSLVVTASRGIEPPLSPCPDKLSLPCPPRPLFRGRFPVPCSTRRPGYAVHRRSPTPTERAGHS